jgi:deaminated glutathione amidase
MRAAAIQMTSTRDVRANLAEAGRLIGAAVEEGAELVVLPENFSFLGATDAERIAAAEPFGGGPAQDFLAEQAAKSRIWLVGGTIPIREQHGERASSRSLLFDPDGRRAAHYDKIHLFDVDIPGRAAERYSESATTAPGTRVVTASTPLARIGMTVCYDIRFPGLFHRLSVAGMDILVVPAAFTVPTGRVHWQPLLQARAIESMVYLVAAGQCGEHAGGRLTYGHSMIIGPWGEILAERDAGAGVVCADLDLSALAELRNKFPVLKHRREL